MDVAHDEAPIDMLPADLLARIFSTLAPAHLHWAELVCRRFRSVVVQYELWRRACTAAHAPIAALTESVDMGEVPVPQLDTQSWLPWEAARRSAFFKRLHYRLSAPQARESLIASAIAASSTDHPQESIDNTLSPEARSRSLLCYWSSAGSEDEDSVEVLTFALAHPLCLVREVDIRPFKAFFQWEHPIYSPKAVRFRLGGLNCFRPDGTALQRSELRQAAAAAGVPGAAVPAWPANLPAGAAMAAAMAQLAAQVAAINGGGGGGGGVVAGGNQPPAATGAVAAGLAGGAARVSGQARQQQACTVWESPVFAVYQLDELQRFEIEPTICIGGLLQVELLGKVQRQEPDQLLYACLAYVRTLGVPLYNFRVTSISAAKRDQGGGHSAAQQQPSPAAGAHARELPASQGGPAVPAAAAAEEPASSTAAAAAGSAGPSSAAGSLAQQAQQAQQQQSAAAEGPAPAHSEAAAGPQQQPQWQLGAGVSAAADQPWPALQLQYVAVDPLLQVGGLARVSENGRVWGLRQRIQQGQAQHGQHGGGAEAPGAGEGADEELWSGSELSSEVEEEFEDMELGDFSESEDSDSEPEWDDQQPIAD